MTVVKVCMLAVLGIAVTAIIKQWKSDFLPLLRIGITVILGAVLLSAAAPILTFLRVLSEENGHAASAAVLFKALGIAVLTQICADICRESGEGALASGVELTGKVEILLLCLPLMEELLEAAKQLLEIGG